ncbi:tRNA threonylcarbamoyladenosine biosynthesis protein TsaE [Scopulibacillus daqui]|uniref:tRNA threonylcarbamoyladenosine biosynthesis protein TsaE n=1 Tax=Scopulibacillus daqui TaxID=1469162 RepID=A0ABS2Q2Y3_9BACL|nr:tRNA (adenosine(37)-N6)-threonylcarbamoyltransferase complex ATPase subunit type 1 TsaE [Scopulibacillus daqui]MBM7646583.1 tRNA threonylcarbamoyladenosine biosynthesis protein TsaE [Scopulibacillus daqui]
MFQWICQTPDETMALAEKLAEHLTPGDVLTLSGDLGAGKTTFTKGIAKGLGIKDVINSPTFTIIKEYHGGKMPLYHMDVYRINSDEDLGFDEYLDGDGITVVEWADNIASWLPDHLLKVEIEHLGETKRKVSLFPVGERFEQICKELMNDENTCH